MTIEFDASLVTGNETIDAQHKELIERIAKLITCCEQNGGKLEAIKVLDFLSDYVEYHFSAEEKLQEEAEYPGIAEHKEKHAEFKQAVKELYEMLEEVEGPTEEFVNAVKKNVLDWLLVHIKGFDCSVASYINMKSEPNMI